MNGTPGGPLRKSRPAIGFASRRRGAGGPSRVLHSGLRLVLLSLVAFVVPSLVGVSAQTVPTAVSFGGTPAVGAIFTINKAGVLGNHFCTGAVIKSSSGNLVLTAAHCVSGRVAKDIAFVPGYANNKSPYGIWRVASIRVDNDWASAADPDDDIALLILRRSSLGARIQQVTGGERIRFNQPAGQSVEVIGYPDSQNDPVSCRNVVRAYSATQLQFACSGYTVGTSGAPILAAVSPSTGRGIVLGVIGGYEEGGTSPSISYAAKLRANAEELFSSMES